MLLGQSLCSGNMACRAQKVAMLARRRFKNFLSLTFCGPCVSINPSQPMAAKEVTKVMGLHVFHECNMQTEILWESVVTCSQLYLG
jgi:hypothetical protein